MTPLSSFHLVRALLCGVALVVVLLLAQGDPSWVEAVILAAVVGVLTYELRELSRRLRAAEGNRRAPARCASV